MPISIPARFLLTIQFTIISLARNPYVDGSFAPTLLSSRSLEYVGKQFTEFITIVQYPYCITQFNTRSIPCCHLRRCYCFYEAMSLLSLRPAIFSRISFYRFYFFLSAIVLISSIFIFFLASVPPTVALPYLAACNRTVYSSDAAGHLKTYSVPSAGSRKLLEQCRIPGWFFIRIQYTKSSLSRLVYNYISCSGIMYVREEDENKYICVIYIKNILMW